MPARTKRRAKFEFRNRRFLWWVDGDLYLRICSADKKFVIALHLGSADGVVVLEVIGQEFPGLESSKRPVWLRVSWPSGDSMGAWVDSLLRWSFDPKHELALFEGPPRFL